MDRPELDAFRKHLPREWIEEALRATGTATLRRRRLPAEQVVWLVLGMALFKDRSITDVVNKLDLAWSGVVCSGRNARCVFPIRRRTDTSLDSLPVAFGPCKQGEHTDELVEVTICPATRRKEPTLPMRPV